MALIFRRCSRKLITSRPRFFSSKSTVDSSEVEQFDKFVSEWWDEFGPLKGLHSLNKLRVPLVRDGLIDQGWVKEEYVDSATPLKGLSILDVGCGGGIFAEPLAKLGADVTGIDATSNLISLAKRHADDNNLPISYSFTSIEEHCLKNEEKYDAVTVSEVIEHITEKEKFLGACAKCLKPNGSIFITTISRTVLANIFTIYLMENVLNVIPKGTHQIEKCIEPHRLERMLEDCNLHSKLIHGMFYNLLTNTWHWCSNTQLTYALHAVKSNSDSDI